MNFRFLFLPRFVQNIEMESDNESKTVKRLLARKAELKAKVEELGDFNEDKSKDEIMQLLHKYNEVKDATQIIIGALANVENVSIRSLHEKFDLPLDS